MKTFYAYDVKRKNVLTFSSKSKRDSYVNDKSKCAHVLSYSEAQEKLKLVKIQVGCDLPVLINKVTTRTTNGVLSKGWYIIKDKEYLVKSCTEGSYEPFGEFLGGNIAHIMTDGYALRIKLDAAKLYPELTTFGFPYVSLVEKWVSGQTEQFGKYVDRVSEEISDEAIDYWSWLEVNASPRLWNQLAVMLITDAVTGNRDRHYNNWDIELKTREIPALIDYGASCLAWNIGNLDQIREENDHVIDKSKSFELTHKGNIELVKGLLKITEFKPVMVCPVCAVNTVLKSKPAVEIIADFNRVYYKVVSEYLHRKAVEVKKALKTQVTWKVV